MWVDIRILFLTLIKVLILEGISPNDQVIMPRFDTLMMERKASDEK